MILITGAGGVVGRRVITLLHQEGTTVTGKVPVKALEIVG